MLGAPRAVLSGGDADESRSITRGYRLATLALLAASGERGMTREKLQAILWAESDASRASASLSQTLYGLRQDLGNPTVVQAVGPTLLLDHAQVASDIQAFESAYAAGDWLRAAGEYGGPFLEGFHLRDAAEFERWTDGVRARLADAYGDALERAAGDATSQGDLNLAVQLWRRRVAHDPLDSRVARAYMTALAAVGDLAGAVRHAAVHDEDVRRELGAPADPAVRRLAHELRARSGESGPVALPVARPEHLPPAGPPVTGRADSPAAAEAGEPDAATVPPAAPASAATPLYRRRWAPFAAVAGLALVLGLSWRQDRAAAAQTNAVAVALPSAQLAVLPFTVADSSLAFLRQGAIDLFGQQLRAAGGLRVSPTTLALQAGAVDSDAAALRAAEGLGVPLVLRGTVVGSDQHLVFNVRLLDVREPQRPVMATAEGPLDSLGVIVDRVVASLLVTRSGEQPTRVGDLSRRALGPLRAYLTAQAAYRNGRLGDAVRGFREALELDPDFALAALGLARSGGFSPGGSTWRADEAGVRASEQAARLSPRDRVLFEAFVGAAPLAPTTAARRLDEWRRAAELFPDDHEALFWYGDQYFHTGAYLGLPGAQDRARELFQQALERDSLFAMSVGHLVELAAAEGNRPVVEQLYARYARLDEAHAPEALGYIRWRTAVTRNATDELQALRPTFDRMPTQSLERIVTFSQLDGGIRLEDAELAAAAMIARNESVIRRSTTLFVAHTLYLNRGRPADARRTLAQLRQYEPLTPGQIEHLVNTRVLAITDALYGGGDSTEAAVAAAALEPILDRRPPTEGRARAIYFAERCALELWQLHRGDRRTVAGTIALFDSAAARPDPSAAYAGNPGLCARILEAQLAADLGDGSMPAALDRLDRIMADGPLSFGGHFGNIVLARLAERAGRSAQALRAVQRRRYYPADGAVYLSTLLELEGRLAAALGQPAVATRARSTFAALRAASPATSKADDR